MKSLRLDEIRRGIQAVRRTAGEDAMVTGVSIDSRTAAEGDLFFAIRGERFDGYAFIDAAAEAGCVAAIISYEAEIPPAAGKLPGGVLAVDDTTGALGRLATYHRKLVPASVVGVTGSNGKTTVVRMIHHILSKRLTGTCSPKSYNNAFGVPLTLLGTDPADDYVICEMGTSGPGEIASLGLIAKPDVAVITSIGPSHLEGLGSMERIATEKGSLISCLQPTGLAVLTAESDLLLKAAAGARRRVVTFDESKAADLRLTGYEQTGRTGRFEINGRAWFDLPLPGRHNARNALAAIAVAQRFGFDQDEAAGALADFHGAHMRLEWLELDGVTVINDAYNANPASMAAAADVLGGCEGRRRTLVAGDMLELGEASEHLHAQAGRQIAAGKVDRLIGVGPGGWQMAEAAAAEGLDATACETIEQACEALAADLAAGDVVLVKGSRAMGMERLVDELRRRGEDRKGDVH